MTDMNLNLPRPKFRIIGARTCQHCHDAREYFSKHNIDHEFIDILEKGNEKYIKDVITDNTLTIPKICREDTGLCVVGFSDDNIKKLMENNNNSTSPVQSTQHTQPTQPIQHTLSQKTLHEKKT